MKPMKSPLQHKLEARRGLSRHPDNRTGSVDGMLGAVVVAIVAGAYCLLTWGGP